MSYSRSQQATDGAALNGGVSIAPLPASGSPLTTPSRYILVNTAGNMGLVFADGTNNDSTLVAVTAGQWFPFQAVSKSPSNTAGLLAVF